MPEATYSLIFRGDLIEGFAANEVKTRLARLFKSQAQSVEHLFSGRPLILKKGLSRAHAEQFQVTLGKLGAQVTIRNECSGETIQVGSATKSQPADGLNTSTVQAPNWTLAPMEGNLVRDHERKEVAPVRVSVGHISLRAAEGFLLDETERDRGEILPVQVPQWDIH
ncbi:hypothetical protein [Microbulbifer spongiae]|uniref:Uncharacterized protein n=1 Tax=Microbulbifer spongiae TaxID=2944933 RepID=A0ABY9EDM4_9GAMM|nr:hypothetical protein [Microbulbifer sp. MI-G]WKD48846.1 hypothetical protein M8T91_13150 [Microbulbifer sp. MI-G]